MIRFGVVGTNFISDWFCQALGRTDGTECAAVYSRHDDTGAAFAKAHGIPSVYTDYQEMLRGDIDAVYIASPHICHAEQALCAMRAGKHVLVEKAAALNAVQFDEMRHCAKANHVVLLEAMRPLFDPAMDVIRDEITQLGRLRYADLHFCQYSSRYDRFLAGEKCNAFDPSLCNAAMMDIGVYCIAVATALFGVPERINGSSIFLNNGFEGSGSIRLDYREMQCAIQYAKTYSLPSPCVIAGENGALRFSAVSKPRNLERIGRDGVTEPIAFVPAENNMIYEINAFCSMINGDTTAERWNTLTAEALRIMDEVRRQNGIVFSPANETAGALGGSRI